MKKIIIIIGVLVLVAVGIYFLSGAFSTSRDLTENPDIRNDVAQPPVNEQPATTTQVMNEDETVIGKSVQGRDITAFHYGNGTTEILFVGGIHGGYEWNTSLVAYELMDYFETTPTAIPENLKVTVIPVLNPDGLNKVVGTTERFAASSVPTSTELLTSGRFNGNNVDLNRNFDCDWQAVGKWQNKDVSGGTAAFSEPESQAIKNYVEAHRPAAAVVWYSAAGGVFASNCHNGVTSETLALTNTFAKASGYKAYQSFNFYEITGDMVNWLAKNKIPAISVLLTNHTDTEWSKNKAGVDAVLKAYAK